MAGDEQNSGINTAKLMKGIRAAFTDNPDHDGVRELELIYTEGTIASARLQDGKGRFYIVLAQEIDAAHPGNGMASSGPYTRLEKREDGTYIAENKGYKYVLDKKGEILSVIDTDPVRSQVRMLGELWDFRSGRDF